MLRYQNGNVELARHAHPQMQHFAGHHVAFVKTFHECNVRPQVRHWHTGLCVRHHGHPQVASEQDAADRVVKTEIALGVKKMRWYQPQIAFSQWQNAAVVRHPGSRG